MRRSTKQIVLYRMLNRVLVTSTCFLLGLAVWGLLASGGAWAQGKPARTETLAAGPDIIDVNLYQDPP